MEAILTNVPSLRLHTTPFFFTFILHVHDELDIVSNVVKQPRVMTSTSPTPDSLPSSISPQPAQQRPHDPYDYDLGGGRLSSQQQQFHFQTSPAITGRWAYNPLGLNTSPLKNKSSRAGLPTVRFPLRSKLARKQKNSPSVSRTDLRLCRFCSNGLRIRQA